MRRFLQNDKFSYHHLHKESQVSVQPVVLVYPELIESEPILYFSNRLKK